jgi:hypothetical protein
MQMSTINPKQSFRQRVIRTVATQDRQLTEILLDRDEDLVNLQDRIGTDDDEANIDVGKSVEKAQRLIASKIRAARSR